MSSIASMLGSSSTTPCTSFGENPDQAYMELFRPLKPTIRQRFARGVRRLKKQIRVNVVEGLPRAVERMRGIEWATAPVVLTAEHGSSGRYFGFDGLNEGENNEGEEGNLMGDNKGRAEEGDDEEWMTAPTSVVSVFSVEKFLRAGNGAI